MTTPEHSVAIIPARGGSKRLPRKNILELGGRPIISYAIDAAKTCGLFERVIVSTDDDEIASIAGGYGAEVQARPAHLADDAAGVTDVCVHALGELAGEGHLPARFCCIYATAAFIEPADLIASGKMLDSVLEPDVVMGVSEYPIHPFKAMMTVEGYLAPMWPKENEEKSQRFPHVVASNGTLYWARTSAFLDQRTFYPERLLGYVLPADRAIDLDTPGDFEAAKRQMSFNAMRKDHGQ